jgi:hypothetical protein
MTILPCGPTKLLLLPSLLFLVLLQCIWLESHGSGAEPIHSRDCLDGERWERSRSRGNIPSRCGLAPSLEIWRTEPLRSCLHLPSQSRLPPVSLLVLQTSAWRPWWPSSPATQGHGGPLLPAAGGHGACSSPVRWRLLHGGLLLPDAPDAPIHPAAGA